jgi:hypothetical protein
METKNLNRLIKVNLNPFTVLCIKTLQTTEEVEDSLVASNSLEDVELIDEILANTVEISISPIENLMFMTKNYSVSFLSIIEKAGIKYEVSNYINELFEMDNLDELLLSLNDDLENEVIYGCFSNFKTQRQKATSIIKSIFSNNFNIDDVLDRINTKGSGSLNEFHKNLLK